MSGWWNSLAPFILIEKIFIRTIHFRIRAQSIIWESKQGILIEGEGSVQLTASS